jgi:hypothetical protein
MRVGDIMADKQFIVRKIECHHCKAKQKVHVSTKLGEESRQLQTIVCIEVPEVVRRNGARGCRWSFPLSSGDGFATQDAAKIAAHNDGKKMKNQRPPNRMDVGKTLWLGQNVEKVTRY